MGHVASSARQEAARHSLWRTALLRDAHQIAVRKRIGRAVDDAVRWSQTSAGKRGTQRWEAAKAIGGVANARSNAWPRSATTTRPQTNKLFPVELTQVTPATVCFSL
jgi:hypothetical protein